MTEDDDLMLGFARVKLKSELIYEHLSPAQRTYMDGMVDAAMTGEGVGRPHHGAFALMAWLQSNDAAEEPVFTLGIAFCAALERWEQTRAGA